MSSYTVVVASAIFSFQFTSESRKKFGNHFGCQNERFVPIRGIANSGFFACAMHWRLFEYCILKIALSFTLFYQRALPWPPNKLFFQFSQSGYTILIDGHASLQSFKSIIYAQKGNVYMYQKRRRVKHICSCRNS